MEPPPQPGVGVGLIAGVDQRTPLHGVHTLPLGEEIRALTQLKSRADKAVFILHPELPGPEIFNWLVLV